MAEEIERKYLIDLDRWNPPDKGSRIVQGYMVRSRELTVRLRLRNNEAFLTIKGASRNNFTRSEFEYPIPVSDAQAMLAEFSSGNVVSKTRYLVPVGKHCWEVDIFDGANAGLAVAEIELAGEDEEFVLPEWVTEEVTGDERYNNAYLAEKPYSSW